jgi:uncharacterized membrane protein SirB2
MSLYPLLKHLHVSCVLVSISFFFLRGIWMMCDSPMLARRWVRIVPHVVDTALLASAIALAFALELNPLATPWLAAKIAGLVIYIALGVIALRRGRTRGVRIAAWVAALAVFAYIVSVAVTRQALPLAG